MNRGRAGRINFSDPVAWEHPLNAGLVGWWLPLENNWGGTTLRDLCGRNHGTLTNGPTWTAGFDGFGALAFDGSNDNVTTTYSASLAPGEHLTVSFALRATSNAVKGIFSRRAAVSASENGWGVGMRSTSVGQLYFGTGSSGVDDTSVAVGGAFDGNWHFVTVTFQRGGPMSWYTDGQLADTTTAIDSAATVAGPDLRMMAYGTGTTVPCAGGMTDARVYHGRLLVAPEVAALYEQHLRGHPDTLRRRRVFVRVAAGSATTTNATPVTSASSVVAATVSLSNAATPVTVLSGVVSATSSLSYADQPTTSASSITTPTTALSQEASAVQSAGSIATQTTSMSLSTDLVTSTGSVATEAESLSQSSDPVTSASSVTSITTSLSYSDTPTTAASGVASITTALSYAFSAVTSVASVPTPVVTAGDVTFNPDPTTSASSVVTITTALSYATEVTLVTCGVAAPTVSYTSSDPNLVVVYDVVNLAYDIRDVIDVMYTQSEAINVIYTLNDRVDLP